MKHRLLVATHNQGKVREFAEMLTDLQMDWLGLDEAGVTLDVAETGATFYDNALLKVQGYTAVTGLWTLADDSGLEVDALGGEPGVLTARYGGAGLTAVERYQLLLENLRHVPWEQRTARFRCVILLAGPDGRVVGQSEGVCEGFIAHEPAGDGGFGYDPVFYRPTEGRTIAQMSSVEKHAISHRGQALRGILPFIRAHLGK